MGGQVKLNQEDKVFAKNRIQVTGNINSKNIEINEEKGYVRYSVAVGDKPKEDGSERPPQWYNFTHYMKKEGEDKVLDELKALKEGEKGKQVRVVGSIGYSKAEKDGETKYYTNMTSFGLKPTESFELPRATIELTGTVKNALKTKDMEGVNPETGDSEPKKFGYMSVMTIEGKDDNKIGKFHNLGTSNIKHMEFLQSLQEGEQGSIKARLRGDGSINIAKDSQVLAGKDYSVKMNEKQDKAPSQDKTQGR